MEIIVNGLGYIGDPHISPRCPSRRLDTDFLDTCLSKLRQALQICANQKLQPVLLGDLFERPRDRDSRRSTEMLSRILGVFATCPVRPIVLAGNHDMHETSVTEDTHLAVVAASGLIDLLTVGDIRQITLQSGQQVNLNACPYGTAIPEIVDVPEGISVLLTHHDFAFPRAYPNALPIQEIKGIDWVVNGHMHSTQPTRQAGQTTYYNPGNIIRQSYADKDHVPAVHVFDGQSMVVVPLQYVPAKEILDESGYQIDAQKPQSDECVSIFAENLGQECDQEKTDDGGILMEIISEYFVNNQVSDVHQKIIMDLHRRQLDGL